MCGITGFLHFDSSRKSDIDKVRKMADVIRHRGPDGEGFYINQNVALGNRRLAIIDLATGDQPMYSEGKNTVIVFNGEIYNYIELRKELKKLGHQFKSNSDTEVIIKSYLQWGADCQNKFNGMWAFAIWDDRIKQLFVSRDRIGEKPLYYAVFDNSFVFGSEIKSLFQFNIPKEINTEMLDIYLSLGYIPSPYSFYKHINKLKAGHYIIVKGDNVNEYKYWDLPDIDESNMLTDKSLIYETFSSLLTDSVKIRMQSDVPYGAFLSGGLDSSCIVAIMSKISNSPIETFTIGFDHKEYDERNLARLVAKKFNTNHHEFLVQPNSFDEVLSRVQFYYDEPFGDSSAIPTDFVSKCASQSVKMVLTGDGGDEALSGYTTYQGEKFANQYNLFPKIITSQLNKLFGKTSKLFSNDNRYKLNRINNILDTASMNFQDRTIAKLLWIERSKMKELVNEKNIIPFVDFFNDFMLKCNYKDNFYRLMYLNLKLSLPDQMLVKVDRMSMANSIETRAPFLDYRLIEFLVKVDKNIKMQGYERKSILRKTIAQQLPTALMKAPKRGFTVPLREWFKDKAFESKLNSLAESEWSLNNKTIREICNDNTLGKKDYGYFIWMLFVLKKCYEN
jgi:asparagine synthase (glutamine-hydrolysing)